MNERPGSGVGFQSEDLKELHCQGLILNDPVLQTQETKWLRKFESVQ